VKLITPHRRVRAEHIADRRGLADNQVHLARREVEPLQQVEQRDAGQRRELRRLHHDAAPGTDCGREFLSQHRQWEVPRRDQRRHAGRAVMDRPAGISDRLLQGPGL
jgi:hypothetical protein